MAEEIKTVMILGGTGNLGPHLISSLSKAGFRVTMLSRNSSVASSETKEISVVQSDYTFDSLVNAFQGQDAVISAIPIIDFEHQRKVIDAAAAAKVKRYLPNEFGVDTSVEATSHFAAFFKIKQDIVAYLKEKEHLGLSWTALCTGPWVDWMLLEGQGLLGLDIKTKTGTLYDSGDQRFTTTTIEKVAEATAAVLRHSEQSKNQYVHVNSLELSQNLLLEALERVSGTQFSMNNMSATDLLAVGKSHLEKGDWDGGYYKVVTAIVYSGNEATCFPGKADKWNKVLGLSQEETVDEMIERVLACSGSSKNSN